MMDVHISPRRSARHRLVRLALTVALITICGFIAWAIWSYGYIGARRAKLFANPYPLPNWLLAVAPAPGEMLPANKAVFGIYEEDRFWPGVGPICIQLDGKALNIPFADTRSLMQDDYKIYLDLNGYSIEPIGKDWIRYGLEFFQGTVELSVDANVEGGVNQCWHMRKLAAGDYLADLKVMQGGQSILEYAWAFRLTGK